MNNSLCEVVEITIGVKRLSIKARGKFCLIMACDFHSCERVLVGATVDLSFRELCNLLGLGDCGSCRNLRITER